MRKSSFLYTAFGVIVVIGALHFIAEAFYLYWTIWWLDIIVHLLAGFSGGLVIAWFFGPTSTLKSAMLILVGMLIIGIAWEVFEYILNLIQPIHYWQDTVLDLVADMMGAILTCIYLYIIGRTPKFS
ncbi:MAG: hypothetical protein A2544_00615 [Candidatus Zambryskibacteria bacterium RIFOXYD2_FULL_43_10]|uniref:VanZ-like domain-containing protein n=1 Tax=Candidatus Zambryskibacteria bacterium RIFOXYD2_FULL_43_10 TaxID=1802782 RepID=A0A1G2V8Z1_9BACT|nr:MAG: hypothetical protein A2544_00615 [Candidatus Zambryskibacteria bacterium RIFOXYD2_FULL_43_10]